MTHKLIIQPLAEADLTDAALWYQEQRPGLGEEFMVEVDAAIQRGLANPRQYARLRRRPDVRRILTDRFPYRIFFILRSDALIVFRVLHGARDDQAWKEHLPGK